MTPCRCRPFSEAAETHVRTGAGAARADPLPKPPFAGETSILRVSSHTALGVAGRFDLKYGMGGLSHESLMINIELYGTQVIPRVRELVAERALP